MNHPTPAPFDALEAAAEELGVPALLDQLAIKDAALSRIADLALANASEHPAPAAMEAAGLLRAAAREREEVGYLPADTLEDAIGKARQAKRHSFAQREMARRNDAEIER